MTADEVTLAIGPHKSRYETTNFEALQAGHHRKVTAWMLADGNAGANILLLELDRG